MTDLGGICHPFPFAWFSVGAAGGSSQAGSTSNVTVQGAYESIGGVKFTANVTAPAVASKIDLSNDWGYTHYVSNNQELPRTNDIGDTFITVTYTLSFSDVSGGDSFENKVASLTGKTLKLVVTASIMNNDGSEVDDNATTALKFMSSGAPTRAASDETGNKTWENESNVLSSNGIATYTMAGNESAGTLSVTGAATFYVGIDGENQYAVDAIAGRSIVITVTPTADWIS